MNFIELITNPKIFNYLIAALYALSCLRFAYELRWMESFYFLLVMLITLVVNQMIRN